MRSLMTNKNLSRPVGLPHAVFLQRVADEPATSPEVRLGQGAFLALRFVDLLAPDREAPTPDVFRYQWAATERYCAELAGEGTEASHLSGIVRATGHAHGAGDITLVAPALFAYALYLEQESHFEEAEDVLDTMIRVGHNRMQISDRISAWMRLGRVRRLQTNFDPADSAYVEAGRIAATVNDQRAMLFSRIGQCNVLFFRGNLAEAERGWLAILADSGPYRRVNAEAEHGLGSVLDRRGKPEEAAPHFWRAFELYEEESFKLRALGDLAISLLRLGDVTGAERALMEIVRHDLSGENYTNALIELMHCASFRRDRVGFERWRERCQEHVPHAQPNIRADYCLKAGIGYARFGNKRRAKSALQQALEIATAHGLHEMEFRIERILGGAEDCGAPETPESAASLSGTRGAPLKEVAASLAALDT
jgi:tetratricopeptide (TPR) repeat protein